MKVRCSQCWKKRGPRMFIGAKGLPVKACSLCRARKGPVASRRNDIDAGGFFGVLLVLKSKDKKLGGIPASYSSGVTCPTSCALRDAGCYGEFGFLRHQWQQVAKVAKPGNSWVTFVEKVSELPRGSLWRHNIVGDLAGDGDALNITALLQLTWANSSRGLHGFTYTHKPLLSSRERDIVALVNRCGFTVNLSADSLTDADRLSELKIGPVVVTLASDASGDVRTPAGRRVVVCPAETRGLTCASCRLCANAGRKGIVGFRAHGQWKGNINKRLSLPVVQ